MMSLVNYATREITCKIVYYGPGRSGKTTNLQYIHSRVPWDRKGEMVSLATEADRTLFFDFLPLELGQISGFTTRFQLYTVPGQVYYNATRKLVLQGADDGNIESLRNLHENLLEHGIDIRDIPVVIQYNKRDLPNVFSIEQLEDELNFRNVPSHPASALLGEGVFDTLRSASEGVLKRLARKL
jgi:signal recognition particle receptor subunit beta